MLLPYLGISRKRPQMSVKMKAFCLIAGIFSVVLKSNSFRPLLLPDNRLNPWQLRENFTPRVGIFAETVSKSADLVLLSVLFCVNPGDTQTSWLSTVQGEGNARSIDLMTAL